MRWLLAVFLLATIAGLWTAESARADSPASLAATTLQAQVAAGEPSGGPAALTARLASADGKAIGGVPVTFYVLADFFGPRLVSIGTATTDSAGIATVSYKPLRNGRQEVVVRFAGDSRYAPSESGASFNVAAAVPRHENAEFGLAPVRKWLPVAVGLVVAGIWGTIILVVLRTVMGLPQAQPAAGARRRGNGMVPLGRGVVLVVGLFLALATVRWGMGSNLLPGVSFGFGGAQLSNTQLGGSAVPISQGQASPPAQYQGSATCAGCHSQNYTALSSSRHANVGCEGCHGPASAHIKEGALMPVNRSPELCSDCHAPLPGRTAFPQVVPEEHSLGAACVQCHNPHQPGPSRPRVRR